MVPFILYTKGQSKMKNTTYMQDYFEGLFLKKLSLKLPTKTFDLEFSSKGFSPYC
jgi:DNA-binding transcriptional regulator WhiA